MILAPELLGLFFRGLRDPLTRVDCQERWVEGCVGEDGLGLVRLGCCRWVEGAGVRVCWGGSYGADGSEGGGEMGVAAVEVDGYCFFWFWLVTCFLSSCCFARFFLGHGGIYNIPLDFTLDACSFG